MGIVSIKGFGFVFSGFDVENVGKDEIVRDKNGNDGYFNVNSYNNKDY